jgi:protocatechuate 3,4-dioxygenase, beta subunit
MRNCIAFLAHLFLPFIIICCQAQQNQHQTSSTLSENPIGIVGGGCDGCELMYIGMPENINAVDTSAGWYENGQKLLVTGTVFQIDGKTPAANIILYYWHTDKDGYYSPGKGMHPKAKEHGHLRGWVKTDANGHYAIYTLRPARYPNENLPAHIHLSIREPDVANAYYPDDIVFDDDALLLPALKKNPPENRCGSGIVRVLIDRDLQVAEHDLVLGLNIPNYPKKPAIEIQSGLNIGEDQPSFIPFHAYGPDKGSQACPVCKYGRYHGILYFVGENPNWEDIKKWLRFLEMESIRRQQYLKAYFVYGNPQSFDKKARQTELENLGKELGLQKTALTFVPSFSDEATEANLNQINPAVSNTFVIYKNRSIVDKFIELSPTPENFQLLSAVLDKTKGAYFGLEGIH